MTGQQTYEALEALVPGVVFQFIRHGSGRFSIPHISPKVERYTGLEPDKIRLHPSWILASAHPEDLDRIKGAISRSGKDLTPFRLEHRCTGPDGDIYWFRTDAVPHPLENRDTLWHCIAVDITSLRRETATAHGDAPGSGAEGPGRSREKELEAERAQYQAALIQAQRMEAIGTLAGGIAHDFNNVLMGIQGQVSLMSFDLQGEQHPFSAPLNAIQNYIQNASNLTRQILGLARGGEESQARAIDINRLAKTSVAMFGRTKKEIRIHTRFHTPAPVVMVDAQQIEQALLNLYVNAWHAMPKGGDLHVKTSVVPLNAVFCRPHRVDPGVFAVISVTDTGIGMATSVLAQIFDPFFTTKEKGQGTGLGLTSAYGIIRKHSGIITVQSKPGQGTNFDIYLPLSNQDAHTEKQDQGDTVTGCETILLVDDEEMITEVGQGMLRKLGYKVLVANSGGQALEILEQFGRNGSPDRVDLVILDVIMPDMSGADTFERIREMDPLIPVILASGYEIDEQINEIMEQGCNAFIQKPFDFKRLSRRIQQLLSEIREKTV